MPVSGWELVASLCGCVMPFVRQISAMSAPFLRGERGKLFVRIYLSFKVLAGTHTAFYKLRAIFNQTVSY